MSHELRASDRGHPRAGSDRVMHHRSAHPVRLTIGAPRFIGFSPQAELVRERIRRVAPSRATVLVTGETGTGKELVARAIHEESGRSEWVAAAVTELCDGVLESELFGHERGAFTGAVAKHTGLFEQADQGTLFLDEIGDAPPFLQAKLLRVLETGEVRPVGGGRARRTRPRVVVATHRDLASMVQDGTFRRDLFYRIHQISIHIAPLRERPADVEPIARVLLADLAQEEGVVLPSLSQESFDLLASHAWPGNVRELRSALLKALLAGDGGTILETRVLLDALRASPASAGSPVAEWRGP